MGSAASKATERRHTKEAAHRPAMINDSGRDSKSSFAASDGSMSLRGVSVSDTPSENNPSESSIYTEDQKQQHHVNQANSPNTNSVSPDPMQRISRQRSPSDLRPNSEQRYSSMKGVPITSALSSQPELPLPGSTQTEPELMEPGSVEPPLSPVLTSLTVRSDEEAPPTPSTNAKRDIFSLQDYRTIDQRAQQVPSRYIHGSLRGLARFLTTDIETELGCVRSLFKWLTSARVPNIPQDVRHMIADNSPIDHLLKIQNLEEEYAIFFQLLCRSAGIHCHVIEGIRKSIQYEVGEAIEAGELGGVWNAVLVDGEWRLLDILWASFSVVGSHRAGVWQLLERGEKAGYGWDVDSHIACCVDEFYFLTDPCELIYSHLPHDSQWQLLDNPITSEEFEDMPFLKSFFFKMGLTVTGKSKSCFISTSTGEAVLRFGLKPYCQSNLDFTFTLYQWNHDGEETNVLINRSVLYRRNKCDVEFLLRFPNLSHYRMEIYGGSDDARDLDLLCVYIFDVCGVKESFVPFPDEPCIGWGPSPNTEELGLEATSTTEALIDTDEGHVEIRFSFKDSMSVLQNLLHNDLSECLLRKHTVIKIEQEEVIIGLSLPRSGEYALKLFTDGPEHRESPQNVCNYLIQCSNENQCILPFPKLFDGILGRDELSEKLGIEAVSHKSGHIETATGQVTISFTCPNDVDLVFELNHCITIENNIANDITKKRVTETSLTAFELGLQVIGEYGFNVYAQKLDEENRLYHVHTYLINYRMLPNFLKSRTLQYPGVEMEELSLLRSKTESEINIEAKPDLFMENPSPIIENISTADSDVEIRVTPLENGECIAQLKYVDCSDSQIKDEIRPITENGDHLFKLSIEKGEYELNIYEILKNGTLIHRKICYISRFVKTHLKVFEPNLDITMPHSNDNLVGYLHNADKYVDKLQPIEGADDSHPVVAFKLSLPVAGHYQFKVYQLKDTGKQTHVMTYFIHRGLTTQYAVVDTINAMASKDIDCIKRTLHSAENAGFNTVPHVKIAKRFLKKLQTIKKMKHRSVEVSVALAAEMKAFSKLPRPPEVLHGILKVVLILLGEDDKDVQEWSFVQECLSKTGRFGLSRRVEAFKIDDLDNKTVKKARKIFDNLDIMKLREVSSVAVSFYNWSEGVMNEITDVPEMVKVVEEIQATKCKTESSKIK